MSVSSVDHSYNSQLIPPNLPKIPGFGGRMVKNITSQTMGIWEGMKHKHDVMEDSERGYYYTAALCVLVILLMLLVAWFTGGIAVIGMLVASSAFCPFVSLSAASILRGRCLTAKREPWQMPQFSPEVKGKPAAETEWKRLWDARNQARLAHKNVDEVAKQYAARRDVTNEEEYARFLLKASEKAEIDFWKFADRSIAYEKITKFNAARIKRGEPELL